MVGIFMLEREKHKVNTMPGKQENIRNWGREMTYLRPSTRSDNSEL